MKLPKRIMQRLWRAIIEFELLAPGDRVLVGLSGGKDSAFLLYSLAILREDSSLPFELSAIHVDHGFTDYYDILPMNQLCEQLGVQFFVRRTNIYKAAFNHATQNPCAHCSYLRRGFINNFAREERFNKVALAHHLDDAVETFLMSQIYSGQLKTFEPSSYLDRTKITVIRPLVYFREKEIMKALNYIEYTPVETPCPLAGKSKRTFVKELIRELCTDNKFAFNNLTAAMRKGSKLQRWPAALEKNDLHRKILKFWQMVP